MTFILDLLTSQYTPLQQWNLSPKDPASYPWTPNFFNIKCLTTILQNKFFISLNAKSISNIIINNKLEFSGSFGVVSIYFSLKMWIWVTVQHLYVTVKRRQSAVQVPDSLLTRVAIIHLKPDVKKSYVNWQTHSYTAGFLTAVCTNCHSAILTVPLQDTQTVIATYLFQIRYMFSSYDHQHAVPELCT